jgi:hypothetical protein
MYLTKPGELMPPPSAGPAPISGIDSPVNDPGTWEMGALPEARSQEAGGPKALNTHIDGQALPPSPKPAAPPETPPELPPELPPEESEDGLKATQPLRVDNKATRPVPPPAPSSGEATLSPPPNSMPGIPADMPPWQNEEDDDDDVSLDFAPRGGLRWALLGAAVVLCVAVGGLFVLQRDVFDRIVGSLGGGAAPAAFVVEDARAFTVLRGANLEAVVELAREVEGARESAGDARARAHAGAMASLLWVRQAHALEEKARVLGLLEDKSAADARAEAAKIRVAAYRRASDARAEAPGLPVCALAMAAYQAERGAVVEMEADLSSLGEALAKGETEPAAAEALKLEAVAQRALAATRSALRGESDAAQAQQKVAAAAAGSAEDRRLAYASLSLAVEQLRAADKPDAALLDATRKTLAAGDASADLALLAKLLPAADGKAKPGAAVKGTKDDPGTKKKKGKLTNEELEALPYETLVARGEAAASAGKSWPAQRFFFYATKNEPKKPEGWVGLGWAYLDVERFPQAVRAFKRATRLAGAPPEALFGLAEAHRFAGEKPEAVAAYEKYLASSPDGADANVARNALKALQ